MRVLPSAPAPSAVPVMLPVEAPMFLKRKTQLSRSDVRRLYEALLGRDASDEDITAWIHTVKTPQALEQAIRLSAEFRDRAEKIDAGLPVRRFLTERQMLDFIDSFANEPRPDQHAMMELVTMRLSNAETFSALDPASDAYKAEVVETYRRLGGRDHYDPHENEKSVHESASAIAGRSDAARSLSSLMPYDHRHTRSVGEFLTSWGAIFKALDLGAGADVLEYGSGTGQLAINLARTGLNTFAADIDQVSLDLVSAQAQLLGLKIETERAPFGAGFDGKMFDAIVFFEAFHHALDFDAVIRSCRAKLKQGGKLILSGEPIATSRVGWLPYPWGLRLDGLSVYCIRRYGWMELGFTEPFLRGRFEAQGWTMERHDNSLFRAVTYVMRPVG